MPNKSVVAISFDISEGTANLSKLKSQVDATFDGAIQTNAKAISSNQKLQNTLNDLATAQERLNSADKKTSPIGYKIAKDEVDRLTQSIRELKKEKIRLNNVSASEKQEARLLKETVAMQEQAILKTKQQTTAIEQEKIAVTQNTLAKQKALKTALANHNARKKEALAIKQANEALKDKLLITSKAEQIERKYKNLIKLATAEHKKQTITTKELARAKKNLNAQMLQEVASANRATGSRSRAINDIVRHVRMIETLVVSLYLLKNAYDKTLGRGHEFNKLIESETIGLKLLISQNLKHTDVLGNAVSAQQRYTFAQEEATKAIALARTINVETPHSFAETLQIFKLLTPQVLRYGGSLEEVANITKRMSIIASSMGIEFQQFLKTVDSAMTGEMKESGLKRALEQFGVTNEGIKEIKKRNGDVVSYVMDGLEQAKTAGLDILGGWKGAIGQFTNEWDGLMGKLQEPLFEGMKVEIKSLTGFLKENRDAILATVKAIGTLAKHALAIGSAYAALKVSQLLFAKATKYSTELMLSYSNATKQAAIASSTAGKSISVATIQLRKLGTVLKTSFMSVAPLLAITAAFEAWNYIMQDTEDMLDAVASAAGKTRTELALLGEQTFKNTKTQYAASIGELKQELLTINKVIAEAKGGTNKTSYLERSSVVGELDAVIASNKEILKQAKLKKEIVEKELETQLKVYKTLVNIGDAERAIAKSASWLVNEIVDTNVELSKQSSIIANATDKESEAVVVAKEKKAELEKHNTAYRAALVEANKLLTSLGQTKIEVKGITAGVEDISKSLEKAATQAYSLASALLKGQKIRGEITERAYLDKNYAEKLKEIESIADADKQSAAAQKAYSQNLTDNHNLEKKIASNKLSAESKHNSLLVKNLQLRGETSKAQQLQIDMINKENIPQADKELKIRNLILSSQKKTTKATGGTSKAIKDNTKELDALYRKYLEITGKDLEIFQMDVSKTMGEFIESGQYSADQLSEIYDGMWDDYADKGKEANEEIAMNFTDQFKDMLESLFEGDMGGALSGFVDGVTTELVEKPIAALSQGLSNLLTGSGGFADALKNITSGDWIGAGIGIVGSFLTSGGDSTEPPPILEDMHKVSESMSNALDDIYDVQYPMLELTREMTGYLHTISLAFGGIENTLLRSGIDIAGNFFESQVTRSTSSLYGTSVDFQPQTLGEMMAGELSATLDWVVEYTSTNWLGRSKTKFETYTIDISNQFGDFMGEAVIAIFDSFNAAGNALDIDTSALEGMTIDIGKIDTTGMDAGEVSAEIEARLSAEVDAIAETLFGAVSEFQRAGEGLGETLYRVITNFDQVSHSMELLNKSVDWRTANIMVDIAGGLDALQSGISDYTENFFSEQEQYDMMLNTMTKTFAALGEEMPTTNAGFRELVEGIDTTTDEGAELFAELMIVSGGFNEMTTAGDELNVVLEDVINTMNDGLLMLKAELVGLDFDAQMAGIHGTDIEATYAALEAAGAAVGVASYENGIYGVDAGNYSSSFSAASASGLTEDGLYSWEAYGSALIGLEQAFAAAMAAYEAEKKRLEELLVSLGELRETIDKQIESYETGVDADTISPDDIEKFMKLLLETSDPELSMEIARETMNLIDGYYKQQTQILEGVLSALDKIQDFVDNERLKTNDIVASELNYRFYLERVTQAVEDLDYESIDDLVGLLTKSASAYIDSIQDNAQNTAQYEYERNVILNELEGIADEADPVVEAIDSLRTQSVAWLIEIDKHIQGIESDVAIQLGSLSAPTMPQIWDPIVEAYVNILGRLPEEAGYDYWANDLNTGVFDVNYIGQSVVAGAEAVGELSREDAITALYVGGLDRVPDAAGLDYWVDSGLTIAEIAANMENEQDEVYTPFAKGGIVTQPTLAMIGEAGNREAVIPLKNSDDPLGQKELINVLKEEFTEMRKEMKVLQNINSQTEKNTKTQRITA